MDRRMDRYVKEISSVKVNHMQAFTVKSLNFALFLKKLKY